MENSSADDYVFPVISIHNSSEWKSLQVWVIIFVKVNSGNSEVCSVNCSIMPVLMQEFESQPEPVNFGTDVAVTRGCQLQVKKIYHAVVRTRKDAESESVRHLNDCLIIHLHENVLINWILSAGLICSSCITNQLDV
jgi:hypothetical protein